MYLQIFMIFTIEKNFHFYNIIFNFVSIICHYVLELINYTRRRN